MVFGNIFDFPELNWAQKWTKTVNFGYFSFPLLFPFLKDCPQNVFALLDTTSGQNVSKIELYLGQKGPKKKTQKGQKGHFMDAALPRKHLKIHNLTTTNTTLIELTTIIYLHKTLSLTEDWGVTHRVQGSVN